MDTVAQQTKPETFIRFRAADELYERVRIEAIKRRITVQQLCTEALTQFLDSDTTEK